MKKLIFATLAALSLVSPLQSQAQDGLLGIKGLSANVGAVSDYRFRGITQTYGNAAVQGGVDYEAGNGFYIGNWNSQVHESAGFPSGKLEMDFYGGFKKKFGDVEIDVGAIHYFYPGSSSSTSRYQITNGTKSFNGTVTNTELYVGASWEWLSVKYYQAVSDYFSVPDTKGTSYLDLSAKKDLGNGWGLNAHVGQLRTTGFVATVTNGVVPSYNYMDYRVGLSKDLDGWTLAASAISTNAFAGACQSSSTGPYCFPDDLANQKRFLNAGKSTVVFSAIKNF